MLPEINKLSIFVAALIPTLLGALWYGPLFGKAWMKSMNFTEDDLKGGNMALIFGASILLSLFIAFFLKLNIELTHKEVVDGVLNFGSHHTFKHGALHGGMTGLLIGVPALMISGLFERKSLANLGINFGYWILAFTLMGGLLDMWN